MSTSRPSAVMNPLHGVEEVKLDDDDDTSRGGDLASTAGEGDGLVPPPTPQRTEEEERLLNIRRKLEFKLVSKFDSLSINARRECWFLVDTRWLDKWMRFVKAGGEPPGPMSTKELLDQKKRPLKGLEATIDYRGVNPMVYYILQELHGKDRSPEIMRYKVDIYEMDVPGRYKMDIIMGPSKKARIKVNKIKQKWEKWDRDDDGEAEETCCWLTKEHIEAIMWWFFTCCNRKGRPKYSKYQPLRGKDDDASETASVRGSEQGGTVEMQRRPVPA